MLKVNGEEREKPRCTVKALSIRLHYDKSMFDRGVVVTLGVKVVTEIATGRWTASSIVDVIFEKTSECFYWLHRKSGVEKY